MCPTKTNSNQASLDAKNFNKDVGKDVLCILANLTIMSHVQRA